MNEYSGWSADTLRHIGDPDVLPELRAHAPTDETEVQDEAEMDAFEEAITELEN